MSTIYDKLKIKDAIAFFPALIALLFFSWQARMYQLDDALIYLRYIKNFQDGLGLVYNPGENFNGLTSPLFTYVMMLGSFLVDNLQVLTVVVSAIFLFAASYFSAKTFSETRLGQGLTALSLVSFGYFYSTFGMETPLFLMLISLSLYLYRKKNEGFIILLSLLVITRSEGIFLAFPMALHYLLTERRLPDIRYIFVSLLIFFVPYIFNFFYYGSPLPVTGSAKIGQGQSGLWGDSWIFFNVKYLVDWVFSGSLLAAIIFLGLSSAGFFVVNDKPLKIISFSFIVGLVLFYGGLNIPNYHWYYAPFFFFGLCFLVRFIEFVWFGYISNRKSGYISVPILVGVFLSYAVVTFSAVEPQARGRFEDYAKIGIWLKENTEVESSVAMVEIGTVGWYSDRHIIDILGLTNKYNAGYIAEGDVLSWLLHYKPDYILIHNPIWPHEESATLMLSENFYLEVDEFKFPGYSLLARGESVVFEDIDKYIDSVKRGRDYLEKLSESTELRSPHVYYKNHRLFSHAPISLFVDVPSRFDKMIFEFGIEEGATRKHSGVCFNVIDSSDGKSLFNECIGSDAVSKELSGAGEIDLSEFDEAELEFNISCNASCDYAWTYWENFRLM